LIFIEIIAKHLLIQFILLEIKVQNQFRRIFYMLSIKKATEADIPLIRDLTMQVWPHTYTPILGPEQVAYMIGLFYSPEALAKQMQDYHHRFIICYNDNKAAGFASYSGYEPGIFKLHKLYVLPELQGMGIGRFMINNIAGELTGEGVRSLRLNVNRYNTSAIGFYEKTGFKHHMEEDIDIGNGYFMNDHVLELEL
jgi:ribosomal protein S18 acetylase RimI-like enzyme